MSEFFSSAGHNLDSDNSCGLTGTGDIPNGNANLGSLALNAPGTTATHALLLGSDAIDAVPVADCAVSTDQRGVARPQGVACDIGAFELVSDSDGDGIPDSEDACPAEDSTGFDADNDGCIDDIQGLNSLIDTLFAEGVIDSTMQNSLHAKIDAAIASLDRDHVCTAINQLDALKGQIEAQTGKKVSADAAPALLQYITNVQTILVIFSQADYHFRSVEIACLTVALPLRRWVHRLGRRQSRLCPAG